MIITYDNARVITLVLLLCVAAHADVGSRLSDPFTIDNRNGSGFRIESLTASYLGAFLQDVELHNTFTVTIDWADKKPSKVVFELNDESTAIKTAERVVTKKYNMGKDLSYSRGGKRNTIKAYAIAQDGTKTQVQRLYLSGLEMPEWAISMETKPNHPHSKNRHGPRIGYRINPLTGKVIFEGEVQALPRRIDGTVIVPDSLPELGGKWGIQIHPFIFAWELGAQPRFGDGYGITGSFELEGKWKASASCGSKRKGEVSASLMGAGEFYPEFRLSEVSAELGGSFKFLFPRVPLLCQWTGCCSTAFCPYFQASIEPEISGTVGMEEGEPSVVAGLRFQDAELMLGVTLAGTIGAGSEGSIYYLAGTLGGKPYVELQFPPDPHHFCGNEYVKKVAFQVSGKAVVQSGWWQKEQVWEFDLLTCPPQSNAAHLLAVPTLRGEIVPIQREYLHASEAYCVFPETDAATGLFAAPNRIGSLSLHQYPLPEFVLNVGTVPTPSLAATTDQTLLLFVADDATKPTGQHQEIYYAMENTSAGMGHAPLTDNRRPDLFPAAAITPDGTYLAAWVTAPEPNGTETGPEQVIPGFEICHSKYDSDRGHWVPSQYLTNNDFVDMSPWFLELPLGGLRLYWVSSVTNAIPVWPDDGGFEPALNVMAADWQGGEFGTPYKVASDLATITPPSLYCTETHEFLVYIRDVDNDTTTGDDLQVVVQQRIVNQGWGADHLLAGEASHYGSTQIKMDAAGNIVVVWVKKMVSVDHGDGNDVTVDQLWFASWNGVFWSKPTLALQSPGIKDLKLVQTTTGRLLAFWVSGSKGLSDIHYSSFVSDLMLWGTPQQITHDQGIEKMLSLDEIDESVLISYVKTRVDLSDTDKGPQPGLSDIHLIEHTPTRDLYLSQQELSIQTELNTEGLVEFCSHWLEQNAGEPNDWGHGTDLDKNGIVDCNDFAIFAQGPGQIAHICADVHLSGDFAVYDVNVSFYDGTPSTETLIGSDVIDILLLGQTKQACVTWLVPGDQLAHRIHAVIDPQNTVLEMNEDNNTAWTDMHKPDVKAGSIESIGYPGGEVVLIGFSVHNVGASLTGPFDCEVRKDSEAGDVIHTTTINSLAPGASATTQFLWEVSGASTGLHNLVLVSDVNNVVVEAEEENNVNTGQVPVLPDLQVEQWSARVEPTHAYITVRNIGNKSSLATFIQVTSQGELLGQTELKSLAAGESTDVAIPIKEPAQGSTVEISVYSYSSSPDELDLLNNQATLSL